MIPPSVPLLPLHYRQKQQQRHSPESSPRLSTAFTFKWDDCCMNKKHTNKSNNPLVYVAFMILGLVSLYGLFLYKTIVILDQAQSGFRQPSHHVATKFRQRQKQKQLEGGDRFLIFDNVLNGQGTGNVINGLLAAHLLAMEFNRTLCIQQYFEFLQVFEPIDPIAVSKCDNLFQQFPNINQQFRDHDNTTVRLVNYESPPNECRLQEMLQSDRHPVLFYEGNTYPRWPPVPDRFFFRFYRARSNLLRALSYDAPPTTVVHLRVPDSPEIDFRKGLDERTLEALANQLPTQTTYLVTNNVEWYHRFETCCQWKHPPWNTVVHSANGIQWGFLDSKADYSRLELGNQLFWMKSLQQKETKEREDSVAEVVKKQNVQMWADWYTILTAKTVYHTHSDFSISAIHWMNNRDSHSIEGLHADGTLNAHPESWWVDGETAPLVERRKDAAGTRALRLCNV